MSSMLRALGFLMYSFAIVTFACIIIALYVPIETLALVAAIGFILGVVFQVGGSLLSIGVDYVED